MVAGGVSFGGRRQRVQYPGAMYHVIQRGNNREYIFNEPEDRDYLVDQMRNAVEVDGKILSLQYIARSISELER
jgi:REP element-mobilizing transposase RayT